MPTVSQPRTGRTGQSPKAGMRVSDRQVSVGDRKSFLAAGEYTKPSDFCRTFKQDMNRLYLLSLLLTGCSALCPVWPIA
jgi:hypothetical protein